MGTVELRLARPPSKRIVLVVPVHNEEESILPFVEAVDEVLCPCAPAIEHEVLFVDDGSTDATEFAIRSLASRNPRIRLISLSRNFGKEAALAAGLDHATADAYIPIDVDLQDPPEVIPRMIEQWLDGMKIVNARRADRKSDSWLKRKTASLFYRIFNTLAERPIPSNVGDFRLLDNEVVIVIRKLGERARFNKGIFSWVGFPTAEIEYVRPRRDSGRSCWSYWKLWNLALDGIFSSSTVPLRGWTYAGLFMAMISFAYAAFIFGSTLIGGRDTPGYASTIILILLFSGLNMIALGIIGEYIGRIFTEVRQRPLYVIRSGPEGTLPAPGRTIDETPLASDASVGATARQKARRAAQ